MYCDLLVLIHHAKNPADRVTKSDISPLILFYSWVIKQKLVINPSKISINLEISYTCCTYVVFFVGMKQYADSNHMTLTIIIPSGNLT